MWGGSQTQVGQGKSKPELDTCAQPPPSPAHCSAHGSRTTLHTRDSGPRRAAEPSSGRFPQVGLLWGSALRRLRTGSEMCVRVSPRLPVSSRLWHILGNAGPPNSQTPNEEGDSESVRRARLEIADARQRVNPEHSVPDWDTANASGTNWLVFPFTVFRTCSLGTGSSSHRPRLHRTCAAPSLHSLVTLFPVQLCADIAAQSFSQRPQLALQMGGVMES